MNLREHLVQAVRGLPDEASVMLPVATLKEWLDDEPVGAIGPLRDLTIDEVAAELDRSASTIRTWCAAGQVEGAYRLQGREWRVPRSALRRFLDGQANATGARPSLDDREADLGAWRRERTGT